jgi:hypothetical protein
MLQKMFKRFGALALVIGAGTALVPVTAMAQDFHRDDRAREVRRVDDRDGRYGRDRVVVNERVYRHDRDRDRVVVAPAPYYGRQCR